MEWCERRLLARIHRLTVGMLRKQIEPVTAAQFMRWLMRWQHVAPGSQVSGERGVLEVLQQLQGFEIPANAWSGKFSPGEFQITIRNGWTSFVSLEPWAGGDCRRIRRLSIPRDRTAANGARAAAGDSYQRGADYIFCA